MITVRKSADRGHADHGWLNSYHTFSFASYYDPAQMGFRSLRVINEDRVAPGRGFGAHAHRDMEILSYVLDGSLAHKDSMGHQEELGPNEIQRMSAGKGVVHSEFNGSKTDPVHFFQIWIEPASKGTPSSYEQIKFDPKEKKGAWKLLAGSNEQEGVTQINQDAEFYVSEFAPGEARTYELRPGRHAWLHVVHGNVMVNGTALSGGDAVAVSEEAELKLQSVDGGSAEVLLFDLA